MLRAIVAVLLILWLLGFVLHIAGGIIHLLAVIAAVVLIYDLIARKKPVGYRALVCATDGYRIFWEGNSPLAMDATNHLFKNLGSRFNPRRVLRLRSADDSLRSR